MSVLDVDAALAHLMSHQELGVGPEGAPRSEFTRSPAATVVGRLAQRDGLMLAHFEHRAPLALDPETTESGWTDGVLPEEKYGSFWHELPVGSFHPGHRAKWGAHELCHGLVGCAWSPSASPLWLATAGRLAELVPVVLWYFLDEIGLARCPDHRGPLFRGFCADCERCAAADPPEIDEATARAWLVDADRFLERELAAVARTRRLGRPVSHVWGSIDLGSDGLAYVAHHEPRLRGRAFGAWAERFVEVGTAVFDSLDALEARAVEVVRGIAEGRPVRPWVGDATLGRARWAAMDVGARLAEVGEWAADSAPVESLLDALAGTADVVEAAEAYADCAERAGLPAASEVFAVGYPVSGVGTRSVPRIGEGLESVVPLTLALFEDADIDPVPAFVADDRALRVPLGKRFADWAAKHHPGPGAELARYEAMLRAAGPDPVSGVLGDGEGVRVAPGAVVESFSVDPVRMSDAVESGSVEGRAEGLQLRVHGVDVCATTLVAARDSYGDLLVVEIPGATADEVVASPEVLDPELVGSLRQLGVLSARTWPTHDKPPR